MLSVPGETQTAGSFVALQQTQGTAQPGFVNITERIFAKGISLFEPGTATSVYSQNTAGFGNGVFNQNYTMNYPGLVGFVYEDTNAAMWAINFEAGTETLLCYLNNGIQVRGSATGSALQATAGANNLAGNFVGDVNVSLEMQAGSAYVLGRTGLNSLATYAPADGLHNINAYSESAYTGIISRTAQGSVPAIWGWNLGTNAMAFLGYNGNGIVTSNGSGGYAGLFQGNVATGFLAVNKGSAPVFPLEVVQPVADTNIAGARILGDGQSNSSIHPGLNFWLAGMEAAGANGVIGGTNRGAGYGVVGLAMNGRGVYGWAQDSSAVNYGVLGHTQSLTNGYGLYSIGRTGATGTKSFVIDHPLDPENKYLAHYCTEGEEPLNVYRGKVTTDGNGFARIDLPNYYESINTDPTIQLTVRDASDDFIMAKVTSDVKDGSFTIRTSRGGTLVFWRLEARRNDRFVARYGAPVEIEKPADRKGLYQQPELYGYGEDRREGRQQVSRVEGNTQRAQLTVPIAMPKFAPLGPKRNDKATPFPKAVQNGNAVSLGK